MFFSTTLTIPPSTPRTAPARATLKVTVGVVTRVWVRWRYGSANLCGVRALWAGFQHWPLSLGQWFPSSVHPLEFEDRTWIWGGVDEIVVEGYNEDDTYEHAVFFAVQMLSVSDAIALGYIGPEEIIVPKPVPVLAPPAPAPTPPAPAPTPPSPAPPPAPPEKEVIVLRNGERGYHGEEDTWIDRLDPRATHGSQSELHFRSKRDSIVLLRFDLSGIKPGAEILRADLVLAVTWRRRPASMPLARLPMYVSWSRSEATWERAAKGRPWEGRGVPTLFHVPLDKFSVAGSLREPGTFTRIDCTRFVRDWYANPLSNFGVAVFSVMSESQEVAVAGDNWGLVYQRPALEITVRWPSS